MPGTERSVTRHPPVLGGASGVSVLFQQITLKKHREFLPCAIIQYIFLDGLTADIF